MQRVQSGLRSTKSKRSPLGNLTVVRTKTLSTVPLSRQLRNIANPSSDELMFLACLKKLGLDSAERRAAHNWNCQRLLETTTRDTRWEV